MPRARILVVDDEKNILTSLSRALRVEDFEVDVAGSAALALEKLQKKTYDAAILDVMMPGMDGLELLKAIRAEGKHMPVLVMSGHGSIETAVEATRLGAHDFLEKPIGTERLLLSLERCLDFRRLEVENEELRKRTGALEELIGESEAMRRLRERIQLAASAKAAVLITGERGTGKELVARAIHRASARVDQPLEKLNCAAVPSELIESELFGHEAGAFTGATKQRLGKFERAHRGTLFLDEIGDMPLPMQAKLLRVLQEGEIERVGGSGVIPVDVRVVSATNRDLQEAIELGEFRADLYDRLNVLPIRVPPLRERREDIPTLAERFLELACIANDRPRKAFGKGALELLSAYDFPGNVRELKNLVERLVILSPGETITEADARALLPIARASVSAGVYRPGVPLRELMDEVEREIILRALDHHGGNVTQTATDLDLERSHLYKKMRALDIKR
ncbi:MAG: sigma-54-dependent Fis family transcriptional regulator [Myxococcales bacterium]|nr:sigma-54-dependent Fis family transcriptional regulator [Myxococcales bacterium]